MTRHEEYACLLACRDDLNVVEEARLAEHLRTCVDCREAAVAYEHHDAGLRRMARSEPRVMLHDRVLDAIDAANAPTRRRHLVYPHAFTVCAAALVLLVLGSWYRGVIPSMRDHQPGSRVVAGTLGPCKAGGAGWIATGQCQIVTSVNDFQGSDVVLYSDSWKWVQGHLHNLVLIVRKDQGEPPVTYSASATNVSFSEVALDRHRHLALYAVGLEEEQG